MRGSLLDKRAETKSGWIRSSALGLAIIGIASLSWFSGCTPPRPTASTSNQSTSQIVGPAPSPISGSRAEATLFFAGYGYSYGDVVLLDTETGPKLGDVVLYDWVLNKSDFQAFGPRYQLARVIGSPTDKVSFQISSYSVNNYVVSPLPEKQTKDVMWGTVLYADVAGLTLQIPEDLYLSDRYVGREGRPEDFGKPDYFGYNRFTVRKDSIKGVVLKKIDHKDMPPVTY